jgi:predicted nucleic acid-binding protein/PHD/YefM family antitoxin component YafN of YafNO toxin-antitoxin module
MTIATLTSREFNQDTARAKKAAAKGPVVITDRGAPAHVLLTYDPYLALTGGTDIVELLGWSRARILTSSRPKPASRQDALIGEMFLLDTNVVSELRKAPSGKADAGVLARERDDTQQGAVLRRSLNEHALTSFAGRILPLDVDIAVRSAGLSVPDRVSERDSFIAANALVHRMTVVTRNIVDFQRTAVQLHNPWGTG